jgi:streptomycin 6-kinase
MEAPISCNFHCRRLERYWKGYWPDVDPGELTADIEERLAAATVAWGLTGIEPLEGGVVALTCAASRHGRPAVLKLNPRGHPDDAQLTGEGDALAFWHPTGAAAELLDRRDDGFTLLLERLEPGHTLDDAGLSPEDRLSELGRIAARLHRAGPPPGSFVHVRDVLRTPLPAAGDEVLAHLDLHGGNALRSGEGWKVIDSKGVRADRHADVWALIDPVQLEALPHDLGAAAETAARWVSVYTQAAGMEPERVREWTRVRARAAALEAGEGDWVADLHRMADVLG